MVIRFYDREKELHFIEEAYEKRSAPKRYEESEEITLSIISKLIVDDYNSNIREGTK